MGGGSYNVSSARTRSYTYKKMSKEEIFSQKHMDPDMNPYKVKIRESRDNGEGKDSYPIIIAFDQTGSMENLPNLIIKNVLPTIMERIIKAGVPNPQIMFVGIGDSCGREEAPLQVGQFESDERIEKWLSKIYLEGCGGGNGHESYPLIWYFADRHIVTDSWEKRHHKGVLITIGDEPCQNVLTKSELERYIGDNPEDDVLAKDLLERVKEKWHVYHIHNEHNADYSNVYSFKNSNWESLLGINAVCSYSEDGSDIGDIIPALVESAFNSAA